MFNMDSNDDRIVEMIDCPTKSISTVLVFVNGHHCVLLWGTGWRWERHGDLKVEI